MPTFLVNMLSFFIFVGSTFFIVLLFSISSYLGDWQKSGGLKYALTACIVSGLLALVSALILHFSSDLYAIATTSRGNEWMAWFVGIMVFSTTIGTFIALLIC